MIFQAATTVAPATFFMAAGVPADIARFVSTSLVDSSLKGVDSHGVMRSRCT